MTPTDATEPDQQIQERPPRSVAEWFTFGIATSILATVIGLVIYDWITTEDRPVSLSISRSNDIRVEKGNFYVPFRITNTGGETAESVQVVAELEFSGEVKESGEQQINFLSGGETEEGAFVFTHDPRSGELTLRVASYKLP